MNNNQSPFVLDSTYIHEQGNYFIPDVDYPSLVVKLIANAREFNIINPDDYKNNIHPLVQQIFKSPLVWEMCAEFWCNFWKDEDSIECALGFTLHDWDK